MDLKRKRIIVKYVSVYAGLNMLFQLFFPSVALALTGGPSQPEMQGFTPIGTTNMVDLSSGAFTYNIPLLDVDGYPINLSYHSGITMDQEASWVGLGWNINPGEINRNMRGLPDDFSGDTVTQNFNMKDNTTIGFDAGVGFKLTAFPLLSLNATLGVFYNNYKGAGVNVGISPSITAGQANKGTLTGSLGINFNSQSGLDITPSIGFAHEVAAQNDNSTSLGITVGTSYNSRSGLKGITMSKDLELSKPDKDGNNFAGNQGEGSFSSFMSFSAPSYTPTMTMPLINNASTLQASTGLGFFTLNPNLTLDGYYNRQTLATHTLQLPAYGYMYSDQAKNNPYALLDFNREKDVPYIKTIVNLPITNFTYDLYSINGQGVSGQFRPFRGDVGILYDHEVTDQSTSASLGLELGFTQVAHLGININCTHSNTTTDQWTEDNLLSDIVSFAGDSLKNNNINYEPFYIKKIGEKTINDTNYYNKIAGTNPMYLDLFNFGFVWASNIFNYPNGNFTLSSNPIKTHREKRNQCTSMLTANEARFYGLDKYIKSYPYNKNIYDSICYSTKQVDTIPRSTWKPYHMSEITVANPDGKRYVYGTPAYNTYQEEATFAVTNTVTPTYTSDSVNLISYSASGPNPDNTTRNIEGRDNYFNQQILPPYAHSYLLTGVLSPDYVDLTGDGITDDDLGEAVKINYTQMYSVAKPYRWRVPYEQNQANYQIGALSDPLDDKANYIYGNKEIWYTHSIESKTMVAQFILEKRKDGLGVLGNNGGQDTSQKLQCLKEIILYSKADLIKNGSKAVPIKTVHFVYDSSLCPGTPNSSYSGGGKLTLKKVYFTYGNNTEGSLSSYQFTYSGFNPAYDHNRYDRWGYFKYNTGTLPSNMDFPYATQDSVKADLWATAWDMTGIHLPSGGQITVDYQSNDYAFVQNSRAMQMFTVEGMSNTYNGTPVSQLYDSHNNPYNWLIVSLPTAIESKTDFYNKYIAGTPMANNLQLYFRFLVDVDDKQHYEYVPGYASIQNYQMIDGTHAAIELNNFRTGGVTASPIAEAAWQYVRLNLPQYAYPGSNTTGGVLGVIKGLAGIMYEVLDIFQGFESRVRSENFARNFIASHSWIRLDNPNYKKYGGGTRVKEIDISDNWAGMASGQKTFKYGQTFTYTNTVGNQLISSGVATYEPLSGGDENPIRQPLPYQQQNLLAPNNNFYTETPMGETLFPAPEIVYSKVTVSNLDYPGVERTATGSTVSEFYTAYDFPVISKMTDIQTQDIVPNVLSSIFSFGVQDLTNVSQGFSVEVNDMPGKEKSQEVYDANGGLISSVNYYYNTDNQIAPCMHLNNNVKVINANGRIGTASMGKDIDVWQDMREQDSHTYAGGVAVNNETFFIFGIIDIPPVLPSFSTDHSRFRSSVTTKYIYRAGIMDSVVSMQNGSYVTTKNLLFDGETGDVVLTQTNNEFNTPTYHFTYPAHWAYDGMGPEYENIGALLNISTNSSGQITLPSSPSTYFASGDEIETYTDGVITGNKYWVVEPSTNTYVVMDRNGSTINSLSHQMVKIIRSGRRNMSSTPVGSFTSLTNPISGDSIRVNQNSNVVEAAGTEYSNNWQIPYTSVTVPVCNTETVRFDTCTAKFLDSIIVHHQLFATGANNIKLGKYVSGGACNHDTSELFSALCVPTGMEKMTSYIAQLGDNLLAINSVNNSNPVYLDSLTPFYINKCSNPNRYRDSVTSGGCLNLFQRINYTATLLPQQDGSISSRDSTLDDGSNPDFMAFNWTCGELHCVERGLVKFDMSSIPTSAKISSATLYLYADTNNTDVGVYREPDDTIDGTTTITDAAWLQRITSPWSTNVTWVSQPTITTTDEVTLAQSTFDQENYFLNVTQLVRDQLAGTNYGFMLREQQESLADIYTSLIFGSNTNPNNNIKPRLVINFTLNEGDTCHPAALATACLDNYSCHDSCENLAVNQPFNPYTMGMMGNWRPERNYTYYNCKRTPSKTSAHSDIWKNGVVSNFTNLWSPPVAGIGTVWNMDTANSSWKWTSQVTKYDLKGNEVEDVDALGRYSSAEYGYIKSLPVAVSSNAKYREIAFDGFEDYGFNNDCNSICDDDHFSYRYELSGNVDTTSAFAHTGKYSLKINAGDSAVVSRSINYYNSSLDSVSSVSNQYLLHNGGSLPLFSPDSGNYLISAWVKENATCGATGYSKDSIVIYYSGSSSKYTFHASGPVIEGWQRFEARFKVPGKATSITVKLVAGSNTAYYDDIRIEPFTAEMKSYVYDPSSLRLLATLDENNYATFYEYNDEGILMRVKKETERGVMTIKESRSTYPR